MPAIAVVIFFVCVVFWLAVFPPKAPRIFLNHRRAVASIQRLNLAERNYAEQHPDVGFTCKLSDLAEQGAEPRVGFIDQVLASGTKSSYHFEIGCTQGQRTTAYTITAVPTIPGITGQYAFCTNQSGEPWYSENGSTSDCLSQHRPIEQKYR